MNARFKLSSDQQTSNCIFIHPEHIQSGKGEGEGGVRLQFGIRSIELEVVPTPGMGLNEIYISHHAEEYLKLPKDSFYQLLQKDKEWLIGPFIGILVEGTGRKLLKKMKKLNQYIRDYQTVGGAILAFSLDGVDKKGELIKGWMFKPGKMEWEWGEYSYPSSIIKVTRWTKVWREHFEAKLGNKVFNNYGFNKWEMYQWLSTDPVMKKHLPQTALFMKPKDIGDFLQIHGDVYIKPIDGRMGKGIKKLSLVEEGIQFVERLGKGKNELYFDSVQDLIEYLSTKLTSRNYILQQSIDLLTTEERIIDFRLILVKNGLGEWEDVGLVSRVSRSHHIVSNVLSGGKAELGEITLKKVLSLSDQEAQELRKKVASIAIHAASGLEPFGLHCGNLGFDFGIDRECGIWIIEINNTNPDHTIALDANCQDMYHRALKANMLYAKRLAGFNEEYIGIF